MVRLTSTYDALTVTHAFSTSRLNTSTPLGVCKGVLQRFEVFIIVTPLNSRIRIRSITVDTNLQPNSLRFIGGLKQEIGELGEYTSPLIFNRYISVDVF